MTQIKDKQINPVIKVAQDVFDDNVDNYLKLKAKKEMEKSVQESEEQLKKLLLLYGVVPDKELQEAAEKLDRSLLALLGVLPETNDVFYSGNQTPTINLSETLSATMYDDTYYFIRQNKETKEVDYYTTFTSGDPMYENIKREMNIIYPETRSTEKQSQKTFKIE